MATTTARKVFKIIVIAVNTIIMLLFLAGCLSPWVKFWPIGFISLLMPYLIVLMLLSIIFWLIAKPKLSLVPLLVFVIGYKQVNVVFAWHSNPKFQLNKQENTLRIVDWNVQSFNGLSKNKEVKKHIKEDIALSIIKLQPDVFCLQEFNTSSKNMDGNNLALFTKTYPYYLFSKDYERRREAYGSGCIIFSKYPIIDTGKIKYPVAESLIYVDIKKGEDTFRIYTTHLQSYKFKKEDYDDMDKITAQDEDALIASKNIFSKMKLAFKRRGRQTNMVKDELDKSPYPSIICGDFNDVPNSYTYFHIKGDRQDAFLKKSFGIGRSFISLAPTLRIDYMLPGKNFVIDQFDMVDEGLSDHIMLVTDLHLKK